MKKSNSKKMQTAIAVSAVAVLPLLSTGVSAQRSAGSSASATATATAATRSTITIKFSSWAHKMGNELSVAGYDGKHTIFKKSDGSLFYVDESTGDMKEVSSKVIFKMTNARGEAAMKHETGNNLSIIGVDDSSHTIMQNSKGDKFYIDQKTGDFIYVD